MLVRSVKDPLNVMVSPWITMCSGVTLQHPALGWHRNAFNNLIYKNKTHWQSPIRSLT
jgi:hypothetical protein